MKNYHRFIFDPELLRIAIAKDKNSIGTMEEGESAWAWKAIDISDSIEYWGDCDCPTTLRDLLIALCRAFVDSPHEIGFPIEDVELRNELEADAKELITLLKVDAK